MTYSENSAGLTRFNTLFEDYLVNIALTQTQADNIDGVLHEALGLFMASYDDIIIYAQGSYAMGTIVKPLTEKQSKNGTAGEYDVDIVLERESWDEPIQALADVKSILIDKYANKVDSKKRECCERVYHSTSSQTGVAFHADYVPVLRQLHDYRYATNRSSNKWINSDTKELKEWFSDFVADKPFVQALIVMLKRIRDYAGLTKELPSICITSIVCNTYKQSQSYAEDLLMAIEQIIEIFKKPYNEISIILPTTDENLAKKIKQSDCNKIRNTFENCLSILREEFISKENPDLIKVRGYLSDDFPGDLSKYPECLEALRGRDLGIELDGSLGIRDIIEDNKGASVINANKYKFFVKGKQLKFIASTNYNNHNYGIRWQVLNADSSDDRRGGLFEAKGSSGKKNSNEFVNYETETYKGTHWIKYFIYEKESRKVVEIGRKFYVEVEL